MINLIDVTNYSKNVLGIFEYMQFLAYDKITPKTQRKPFLQAIYFDVEKKCFYSTNSKAIMKYDLSNKDELLSQLVESGAKFFSYSKGILKALDGSNFERHPKANCERVIPITEKAETIIYPTYDNDKNISDNGYINYYFFNSVINTSTNRINYKYFQKLEFEFDIIGKAGGAIFGKNECLSFVVMPYCYDIKGGRK